MNMLFVCPLGFMCLADALKIGNTNNYNIMKKTITEHEFVDAFDKVNRSSHFSYEGRQALFEYLEQLEEDTGEEIELDVIAFCSDYSEYFYKDFALLDYEGLEETASKEEVRAYLEDKTQFIEVDEENFIIQNF